MDLVRVLLGRRLSSEEESTEHVGVLAGVAVYGLDALGSAAYGPEAALTMLIPAGLSGLGSIVPLSITIALLLLILFFSYRQTISAYPNGGGAYTVAGQNLGQQTGMLAGAALMLDYLLNVSVGISTGVGALVSAVPKLQKYTLVCCLAILLVIILANLRGLREAGILWMLPTYIFLINLGTVVTIGLTKSINAGGHLQPVVPPAPARAATVILGPWLLIRSFAAGCTALTGVEAASNGVRNFSEPKVRRAKATLTFIVSALAMLLLGISWLVLAYGIMATPPAQPGYQSILSMLTSAVTGRGWFYYLTMASILTVLSLSANTSFADFPMLCRIMAEDGYLPKAFTYRGRRLAYTSGIIVLGLFSASILMIFGGVTDRLIPLFAIGAFLAFTLSQAGMVEHWRKSNEPRAKLYASINGIGAVATGLTTLVVFVAKFREGAWLTAVILGCTLLLLRGLRWHHDQAERILCVDTLTLDPLPRLPMMLVPISRWNRASLAALQFACSLSDDVRVLHITDIAEEVDRKRNNWQRQLDEAAHRSAIPAPRVICICSPYRSVVEPLIRYVAEAERESPDRKIAVVIAEVVASRWYQHVMHNYSAMLLKWKLFINGNRRVVIVDMPWQLPPAS